MSVKINLNYAHKEVIKVNFSRVQKGLIRRRREKRVCERVRKSERKRGIVNGMITLGVSNKNIKKEVNTRIKMYHY